MFEELIQILPNHFYVNPANNQNSLVICSDYKEVLKLLPNNFFDLVICDIPYGINVGKMAFLQEKGVRAKQKNGSKLNANKNKKGYTLKDWDSSAPGQEYFDELVRVSKHQIIFGIEYVNWKNVGHGRIKWNKGVAEVMSFKQYELAYCSMIDYEHEIDLLWSGMLQAKSLAEPMVQQGNKKLNEKRNHPCHKPTLLYKRILIDFGKEGWVIGDTHLGDGQIRTACNEFNCSFIGMEIDQEYFDYHVKSFNQYTSQLKLFF